MIKAGAPLVLLGLFFIGSTYLVQTYGTYFSHLLSNTGLWGLAVYTCIAVITTVVAPLSSVPLIPIVSNLWGPVVAAITSIIGWLLGAMIAFFISRRYGRRLVEKLVSTKKLDSMEKCVPKENLFWSIVVLRMTIPVDILSYVLGLFSTITWRAYFFATLIGITPFAFVIAYAGTLPVEVQLTIFVFGLGILLYLTKRRNSVVD